MELKNAGSTEATLAVRNACMQKSRLCSTWHSSSCGEGGMSRMRMKIMLCSLLFIYKINHKLSIKVLGLAAGPRGALAFVSIARVSLSWKCSFNFDLPSSLEPRSCENLYCQTTVESAPSVREKPACQSSVRPPLLP